MSRSTKKGPYIDAKLLKKVSGFRPDEKAPIKTWARSSSISPEMIGFAFAVHNGKDFINIRISEEMVGHKFGEFALTRKFIKHGGKMQKELEKKATAPAPASKK